MPQPRHRRQSTPADDREVRRVIYAALLQNFIREVLVVILKEIWRGGPW
jgi:hypothetical protein